MGKTMMGFFEVREIADPTGGLYREALDATVYDFDRFYSENERVTDMWNEYSYDQRRLAESNLEKLATALCAKQDLIAELFGASEEKQQADLVALRKERYGRKTA